MTVYTLVARSFTPEQHASFNLDRHVSQQVYSRLKTLLDEAGTAGAQQLEQQGLVRVMQAAAQMLQACAAMQQQGGACEKRGRHQLQ
jgi:hypothetical protein